MADVPRYRFGPLERRGVLAGLRVTQLLILGFGGVLIIATVRALLPAAALASVLMIGLVATFAAFVPIGGRALDEWLPVLSDWTLARLSGKRRFVSRKAQEGLTSLLDPQPEFPPSLKGLTILSHAIPGSDSRIGVVKDARNGTFTGVLAVRGKSFALLDGPEKARRLASWAGILSGLAREGGVVHRLQWVERTVPDSGNEIGNYLKENIAVPVDSLIARSYLEVVDEAGPVTQQHETFVSLQIHAGRSARAVKTAGGGDEGACEVLRGELTALSSKLVGAEVGWVMTTALNLCRREVRRSKLQASISLGAQQKQGGPIPDRLDLVTAIRRLPIRQREAIILHYIGDLPISTVADHMNVSEGSVKTHLSRARETLRASLLLEEGL